MSDWHTLLSKHSCEVGLNACVRSGGLTGIDSNLTGCDVLILTELCWYRGLVSNC